MLVHGSRVKKIPHIITKAPFTLTGMAEPKQNWTGVWLLGKRKTLCVTQKIIQPSFTSVTLYLEVKWLWHSYERSCKRKQKLAKCKVKMCMQNQTCWLEILDGNQPTDEEHSRS